MVISPLKFTDKEGVSYFISAGGVVFIELPTKKKKKVKNLYRKIGKYDFYNKTFIKYEKLYENAIFQKLGAFGFPYHLLKKLHTDKNYGLEKVVVEFPYMELYTITADKLFEKGFFLNYKNKGYEVRIYVKIEEFEKMYIHPRLKEKTIKEILGKYERKRRRKVRWTLGLCQQKYSLKKKN